MCFVPPRSPSVARRRSSSARPFKCGGMRVDSGIPSLLPWIFFFSKFFVRRMQGGPVSSSGNLERIKREMMRADTDKRVVYAANKFGKVKRVKSEREQNDIRAHWSLRRVARSGTSVQAQIAARFLKEQNAARRMMRRN